MILQNLKISCWKFLHKSDRLIATGCIWLLIQSRTLLGPSNICPLEPGCTQFALQQLEQTWTVVAVYRSTKRVLGCNPISLWIAHKRTL
jgi:putative component of membrane protein insertase Oxa1/YidC/SpoIIIJ protein YidD